MYDYLLVRFQNVCWPSKMFAQNSAHAHLHTTDAQTVKMADVCLEFDYVRK